MRAAALMACSHTLCVLLKGAVVYVIPRATLRLAYPYVCEARKADSSASPLYAAWSQALGVADSETEFAGADSPSKESHCEPQSKQDQVLHNYSKSRGRVRQLPIQSPVTKQEGKHNEGSYEPNPEEYDDLEPLEFKPIAPHASERAQQLAALQDTEAACCLFDFATTEYTI